MMKVPFLDVAATYLELKDEIDDAVMRVLSGGAYILGREVQQFEEMYADYCSSAHTIGVGNGLEAMFLALLAMDIGPGDEVIVPANTYIATWLAVSHTGARPIPVEPDPVSCNIDPERIEDAITPRTRAIIAVHLYGYPAKIDRINEISRRHGLFLLEDAAHAHGAVYMGKRIGTHGDAVAWSFFPSKNLGAFGDGGGITTNNTELANKIRSLRNYGSTQKYFNEVKGYNSRLDPIHAATLRVKLAYLDSWNARRNRTAEVYRSRLIGLDILLPPGQINDLITPAWHVFVIRTAAREALQQHLADHGVETLIHYPVPPHHQKAYQSHSDLSFPISEQMASQCLSLPIGPHLKDEQVDQVCASVLDFFA